MPEKKKVYRMFKVAKELNVGIDTLVDHLSAKDFEVKSSPNEKLSPEMYDILLKEFASEKVLKEKAEQMREKKMEAQLAEEQTVEEEEIISAEELRSGLFPEKKGVSEPVAEKQPPVVEKPVPEPVKEVPKKVAEPVAEKQETQPVPEEKEDSGSGLKVIGKIDLDSIGKKKKKEAPPKEKAPEPPVEPPKVEEKKPEKVEAPVAKTETKSPLLDENKISAKKVDIEKEISEPKEEDKPRKVIRAGDSAPRLSGLTVLGKIELPADKKKSRTDSKDDDGDDTDASGKKRRRRKRKKSAKVSTRPGTGSGDKRGDKKKKEDLSDKEIQEQIKVTLANLNKKAGRTRQRLRRAKRDEHAKMADFEERARLEQSNILEVTEFITANELANLLEVPVTEIITKCMDLGLFVSINQRLEADVIQLLGEEYGYQISFIDVTDQELQDEEEEELADTEPRAPIITVMGHVDHGKTSLLDYIRDTNVIAGEAGGITQHIGAYEVELDDGREITFLDTPGHEAFTAMRARGAKATDVAIIVIAADDSVMPQTKEAINHAQAAGVPMVFAINKIDKAGAEPQKILEQLSQMNILTEAWGGKHQTQEISAKTGQGIGDLLDKVLLEAEMLELKANAEKTARGTVIEAKLDKGRGIVATLLVQNGTLRIGDTLVAGIHFGKIKALMDERGNRIEEAGPSTPTQVLGLIGAPQAGDMFRVYDEEKKAKEIASKRAELYREQKHRQTKHITLDEIARRKAKGDFRELNIIIKGDVDGSIEALSDSLLKLSTDEVQVNILMKAVGQISESDVNLASASDAIIVGFQVRPSPQARRIAEKEGIDIRLYSIIYDTINDVKDALEGLLAPEIKEKVNGLAEIREIFKVTKVGTVGGCMIVDGKVTRNDPVRLIRDGIVIYAGKLSSLKRFKDDAKEVREGFECGLMIDGYNDIKVGDHVESYSTFEEKRTL